GIPHADPTAPISKEAKPSSKVRAFFRRVKTFLKNLSAYYSLIYKLPEPPKPLDIGPELVKMDRLLREACGKRVKSLVGGRKGRRWSWRLPKGKPRGIHLAATIRAAAKRTRRAPLEIGLQDVLEPLYIYRAPATIMFILDASDSMYLTHHLVRKAVSGLCHDFRIHRDKVGLVILKNFNAKLIQKPTRNFSLLEGELGRVVFDGLTPLASGILLGLRALREEVARNPHTIPILVLVTDGGANVPASTDFSSFNRLPSEERDRMAVEDAVRAARTVGEQGIKMVIINTNPKYREGLEVSRELARASGGLLYLVGEGLEMPSED
ncbi:hypothetical protein DRO32_05325, partial [Candidatus Bathyarchaeota archaeon]